MSLAWFAQSDVRCGVAISRVTSMSSPESDTVGAFGHAVSPLNH